MSRRICLAPLWAVAWVLGGACGSGIGVSDGGTIGTPLPDSSTGPGTGPGSSGTGSSGATPTGSDGSGTAGASTTGAPTTGAASTSSTGSTGAATTEAASTGTASTGDASTGAPLFACVDVSGKDHGDCEAELGYAFDGTSCRLFSGCDCAPDCDSFSPDPATCAESCAALGECNEAVIHGAALARDPIAVGSFCDQVDACADPGSPLAGWLMSLFPGVPCEPGFPCTGSQSCHLQFAGIIDAPQWTQLCAASLLPGAALHCVVFGP